MDNHKLVTISIFEFFFKHEKDAIFFMNNILGKISGFGRMQQNIFLFLKMF